MAIENFIPTLWSARILQNLHKSLVFGQAGVINRDYEGEIRNVGDSVKINAIGSITVGSYTKNSDINDPEDITGAGTTLLIDQANYFNFPVDDIDRVQARPDVMSEAMREAGYARKDELDGKGKGGANEEPKSEAKTAAVDAPPVPAPPAASEELERVLAQVEKAEFRAWTTIEIVGGAIIAATLESVKREMARRIPTTTRGKAVRAKSRCMPQLKARN